MIRLGYTTSPQFWQGNSTDPPYQGPDKSLTADENLAKQQLKDIQAYLTYVGTLFAWMNGEYFSGLSDGLTVRKSSELYARSESSALTIVKSKTLSNNASVKDEYRLNVNFKLALKNRKALRWNSRGLKKKKYKATWILERLYVLAKSPVIIDVWLTGDHEFASGQTGGDFEGHDWRGRDNKGIEPATGAKCTKAWVMLKNRYEDFKYSSELKGQVYVHELIVHAWRQIEFGFVGPDKPKSWGGLKWFIRQHHRHVGHTGLSSGKHSLADLEGDFLTWYLFFNQDWVDKKIKKGAHDARNVVGVLTRNMKPPMDAFGVNWFSYAGLKKRIAEGKKKKS